jgi:hypothetical protein
MACMTLLAQPVTMATTQLAREIPYKVSNPWQWTHNTERQPLRMNWVVVTGKNGRRQLRMQWLPCGN